MVGVVRIQSSGDRRPASDVREVRSDLSDHARVAANRMATETRALSRHQQPRAAAWIAVQIGEMNVGGDRRRRYGVARHSLAREGDESSLRYRRSLRHGSSGRHASAGWPRGRHGRRVGACRMAELRIAAEIALRHDLGAGRNLRLRELRILGHGRRGVRYRLRRRRHGERDDESPKAHVRMRRPAVLHAKTIVRRRPR